jgi:protein OS-9
MRNLLIYLSALSSLSPVFGFRHGAAQLRDLLAYPKYDVQFLNDLPVSASDAERAKSLGVEREEEWLSLFLSLGSRRRLSDGGETAASAVSASGATNIKGLD